MSLACLDFSSSHSCQWSSCSFCFDIQLSLARSLLVAAAFALRWQVAKGRSASRRTFENLYLTVQYCGGHRTEVFAARGSDLPAVVVLPA